MKPVVIAAVLILLAAGRAAAGVLSPALERQLEGKSDQDIVKVLVVLREQPDVANLDAQLHYQKAPFRTRHTAVISTLQQVAQESRQDLLVELSAGKSGGGVIGFTPHWIVNSVVVKASVARVRSLAARDDVLKIEPDLEVELIEPVMSKPATLPQHESQAGFITPGLIAIGADRTWDELGIDGTGSLVANMDSGVDGTHPALASRWRGNSAPAAHCWRDHGGQGSPSFPIDLVGHGTHVMGTITGTTLFERVGVAPGAQWIASNAVSKGGTFEDFDNAILAAFEWFADPDGDPATTDDVPDVVQNSWGVSPRIGPWLDCDSTWWDVIDNCEAAGVVVVFSAGNDGPGPETLNSPGDRASSPTNCFTVGSTTTSEPFSISLFSSRGPSACGGDHAMKPEVAAPGQDILSTVPGGAYAYLSGTSMAAPHVSGVVALMRQANPDVDVTTIKEILMETARDLGPIGEDNTYGHGIIDAYAAVLAVLTDVGSISGVITDADTDLPLEGARIHAVGSSTEATTEADGAYSFTMRAGVTEFSITRYGYDASFLSLDIPAGDTLVQNIALTPSPWAMVSGVVYGPDELPFEGATITALGEPTAPVVSDVDGSYEILLPAGPAASYQLKAIAPSLAYDLRYVGLQDDTSLDFFLPALRADGFESQSFDTFDWQQGGDVPWVIVSGDAQEGSFSAKSGDITHSQDSELRTDYYVNGDGEFSFWFMLESEIAYDRLVFSIDGEIEAQWSGQVGWTRFSKDLETGLHSFLWVYHKDGSVSLPRDSAWIDAVSFPGTGVQPYPELTLDESVIQIQADTGTVVTLPWTFGNTGGFRLDYVVQLVDTSTGQAPSWLSAEPAAGFVHPGSHRELNLSFDGFLAGVGISSSELTLLTNDPNRPVVSIAVEFEVAGATPVVDGIPGKVVFRGAVPNPFNPTTEIRFEIPEVAEVSLKIFDVSGRLVRVLVDEPRSAGEHRARWNGEDAGGRAVASGVYFAQLSVDGTLQSRPMALVR